jgi:cation diffusion facilitator family transporter
MTVQRRTALFSVFAALALIGLKLGTGLATGSLGFVSEAVHSGTDLIAALLTFFAVGVAVRPADTGHQYGHGKAEHLSALAEGTILVLASLLIIWRAIGRLTGSNHPVVSAPWWAIAVIGVVLAIDIGRTVASARAAKKYGSAALSANALHFASDFAGSVAVLIGLLLVRQGYVKADSIAALFVALLVLVAAIRLMRRNIDVLMDIVPADAEEAARLAIVDIDHRSSSAAAHAAGGGPLFRRRRDRRVGRRCSRSGPRGRGRRRARGAGGASRGGRGRHVEPLGDRAEIRERAHAAALGVRRVREVHNVNVVSTDAGTEISLHLKLPGELSLDEAHEIAEEVERAIIEALPEVSSVRTHLEPLAEAAAGTRLSANEVADEHDLVARIVQDAIGVEARDLGFVHTDDGLVVRLTLPLAAGTTLADAHAEASRVEELIRRERPEIADVLVHTEPLE